MRSKTKYLVILHIFLAVYSMTGIASKLAAQNDFMSFWFIFYYCVVLLGLFVYAVAWQQIIKHMPLITAYANRGVTVIWGIVWGYLFFSEEITVRKLIGAAVIVCGIVFIVTADAENESAEDAAGTGSDPEIVPEGKEHV